MTTLRYLRLRTYQNLQILEERKAKQGSQADLKLINEIEDHYQALALIDQALASGSLTETGLTALKSALRPLLIATNVEGLDVDKVQLEIPTLPFEPETVLIPAGPFLMGSLPAENVLDSECPQHEVDLRAYRIGVYPVTNRQYAEFITQNGRQGIPKKAGWFLREPPANKLDHPVVSVSWHDAQAYCRWLSDQTQRRYRLPTEAEWEKAASWADGHKRLYPWGNTWQVERCNTGSDDTTSVYAYPAGMSAYGCYDLAGNVQEWVTTLWGADLRTCEFAYPYRPSDGREDLEAEKRLHRVYRIHRGGAFRDSPANLRCSARGVSDPDSKLRWRGFRVVLEI